MTATRVLVTFRCRRKDCTNSVVAVPGSTATCWRHPRGEVMQPVEISNATPEEATQ